MNVEEDFIKGLFCEGETRIGRTFVHQPAIPKAIALHVLDNERATEVINTASHRAVGMCYCRWEYAARGGSTEAYYGDLNATAWYQNNSGAVTHSVAQKQPNGFGLFDVLGNVSEWVNDWHENNYYLHSPAQDPPGPATGKDRVLRGGSYNDVPKNERLSLRFLNDPSGRLPSHGVRCACERDHLH